MLLPLIVLTKTGFLPLELYLELSMALLELLLVKLFLLSLDDPIDESIPVDSLCV